MTTERTISFERRRYGNTTFTWAFVQSPRTGEWLSLGDPWQGVNWPKIELERLSQSAIERESQ